MSPPRRGARADRARSGWPLYQNRRVRRNGTSAGHGAVGRRLHPTGRQFISAYALGVVIGAPVLAVATSRMEKRNLLLLLAAIVLVGNLASAVTPDYLGIAAARFVAGLPHGAYYGTASIVAAAMAPPSQRRRLAASSWGLPLRTSSACR
ncbi:MFS transporter [Bradyrhizobium jicamae]|uniref:MFS transporter n=1 Tax=Bradyrhizobium jicamae TaxID=280332 RepID=UPI00201386E4|nr:MFS transporter [Bradyrhizobium jicamae]